MSLCRKCTVKKSIIEYKPKENLQLAELANMHIDIYIE